MATGISRSLALQAAPFRANSRKAANLASALVLIWPTTGPERQPTALSIFRIFDPGVFKIIDPPPVACTLSFYPVFGFIANPVRFSFGKSLDGVARSAS